MELASTLVPSVDRFAVASPPASGGGQALASFPFHGGAGSARAAETEGARDRIQKTARDFEASFLSMMLGQAFSGVETSAPFGGGQGEQMYKSLLSDAFAKSMAARGGVGVSKAVASELMRLQGISP